ncbi:MAG: phytoene/squalene synthase family protein [Planctomycetota bacterium]
MSDTAKVIERHSRSFSLASRLLPRAYRECVTQLYAWCRTVDDVVDLAKDQSEAKAKLLALKEDILSVQSGRDSQCAATRWIENLIRDRRIDARHAIELIEGMELDLNSFKVRSDWDLRRYCYHAAGTVGLMMAQMMGANDPVAREHAVSLGVAMQMTNIARDVLEDAKRGRSYLPQVADPLGCSAGEVQAEVRRILRLAEAEYKKGLQGLVHLPATCRPAIRVAGAVYREIGREIERRSVPVMDRRVVLPRWRLLWVALRARFSLFGFTSGALPKHNESEWIPARFKSFLTFR